MQIQADFQGTQQHDGSLKPRNKREDGLVDVRLQALAEEALADEERRRRVGQELQRVSVMSSPSGPCQTRKTIRMREMGRDCDVQHWGGRSEQDGCTPAG